MNPRTVACLIALSVALAVLLMPDLAFASGGEAAVEGGAHGEGPAVPWTALGLQAFNLVLLFGVIAFFGGGKIRDAMKDRSAEIKHDIDDSNRLRKEARERFEELDWRLAGFEQRLVEMKAEAEAEAEVEKAAVLERADREALRLQEAAQRTIRSETAKARMALRKDAVTLAVKLAEERIVANVGPDDDGRLAGDFFSEFDSEVTLV